MQSGRAVRGSRWRWLVAPFSPDGLAWFALAGFSVLSAFATAQGFADLRAANLDGGRLAPFDLILTYALAAFVIAAMIVALHNLFDPRSRWWVKILSGVFYLFFAVWSVGFGYGYFWKELAGQEFTRTQFEAMLEDASASLAGANLALETVERAAREAADLARTRADTEAAQGGTCANRPGSIPGDGPLTRARFQFADRARALAEDVRAVWIEPLAGRRDRLDQQLQALRGGTLTAADPTDQAMLEQLAEANVLPAAERRRLYLSVHDEARAFAQDLNAMRDLHAPSFSARLNALAEEVGPPPAGPIDPAWCSDGVLADRLSTAAAQISTIAPIPIPQFEVVEGAQATRAAFFGLLDAVLGRSATDRPNAVPFGPREMLALFASLAVDLGIVFLTLVRLAGRKPERMDPGAGAPRPPVLATILPPEP